MKVSPGHLLFYHLNFLNTYLDLILCQFLEFIKTVEHAILLYGVLIQKICLLNKYRKCFKLKYDKHRLIENIFP